MKKQQQDQEGGGEGLFSRVRIVQFKFPGINWMLRNLRTNATLRSVKCIRDKAKAEMTRGNFDRIHK